MRALWMLTLVWAAGCDRIDGSSGWVPPTEPFQRDVPVAAEVAETPEVEEPSAADHGHQEAAGDHGHEEELTDDELMAIAMGVDPEEVLPEPEPVEAAEPVVSPSMRPSSGMSTGTQAVLSAGWGVRLVSTLPGTQPPRAVLGLPSGEEVVVEPGSFVPKAKVVVLAVGRDAVQVAYVEPSGDRTFIRSETLTPLHAATKVPTEP